MAILIGADTTGGSEYFVAENYYVFSGFTASASGDVATIYVRLATNYSTYVRFAIHNASGTRLAESSDVSASAGIVSAALSATVTESTRYFLGVVGDGGFEPYHDATTWNAQSTDVGSFATPSSISGLVFDDETSWTFPGGKIAIWAQSSEATGLGGSLTDGGLLVGIVDGGLAR